MPKQNQRYDPQASAQRNPGRHQNETNSSERHPMEIRNPAVWIKRPTIVPRSKESWKNYLTWITLRIEEHFGGLKSDISILRHELKEEIKGVKSTLTEVQKSLESAWNVIPDLRAESKSHSDFTTTYQSSLDNVKSELAMTSLKNAKLETEIDALKVRFLEEQEKVIALENYSRRENLLFMNVPEQTEQEGENCANNIFDIIKNELNIDVENLKFHAIHRVGKRRSSDETSKAYPRPVIARFLSREDRDMVLRAKGGCETLHDIQTRILLKDYAKAIQMEEKF